MTAPLSPDEVREISAADGAELNTAKDIINEKLRASGQTHGRVGIDMDRLQLNDRLRNALIKSFEDVGWGVEWNYGSQCAPCNRIELEFPQVACDQI